MASKNLRIELKPHFSRALRHYQKVIREADPRPLPFSTIVESALMLLWGDEATKAERGALEIATGSPRCPAHLRGLLRK